MFLAALGVVLRSGWGWPDLVAKRLDHCPEAGCDFVHHYLPQARILFEQRGVVVFGWVYPPLLALVLRALTPFSDETALRLWTGLNLAFAAGLVVLCRQVLLIRGRWASWAGALGLVLLSLPVLHCLKWGQVSLVVGTGASYALSRRTRWAGPIMGLLGALKLYPVAYLALPLVRRERFTVLQALLWAASLGFVLPMMLLGFGPTLHFFAAALSMRFDIVSYLGGQALWPSLLRWFVSGRHVKLEGIHRGLITTLPMQAGWHSPHGALAILVLVLPLVAVALLTARRLLGNNLDAPSAAALALTSITLLVGPGWHHYFVFLPFAVAVVLGHPLARRREWILALASWFLSALPVVLLADAPATYFRWSDWGGTTLSALLAWLALLGLPGPCLHARDGRNAAVTRQGLRTSVEVDRP